MAAAAPHALALEMSAEALRGVEVRAAEELVEQLDSDDTRRAEAERNARLASRSRQASQTPPLRKRARLAT